MKEIQEKVLAKVSDELFVLLLKAKDSKVGSINTLILFNESLKMIRYMEDVLYDKLDSDQPDIMIVDTNNCEDENFDKVLSLYNRLLWMKENYVDAWH